MLESYFYSFVLPLVLFEIYLICLACELILKYLFENYFKEYHLAILSQYEFQVMSKIFLSCFASSQRFF